MQKKLRGGWIDASSELERILNPHKIWDSQKSKVIRKVIRILENNDWEKLKEILLQRLVWVQGVNRISEYLGAIDTDLALKKVQEILSSPNVEEIKVKWAALYMMTYHWSLIPSDFWISDKQFVWYKALWGKIWDEIYNEQKTLAEQYSYELTDEVLLLAMIEPKRFDQEVDVSYRMGYLN